MLKQVRSLLGARRALAGLEFALILPLMVLLLAGLVDLSLLEITLQRLNAAARETSTIASTLAVQPGKTNSLTVQQVSAAVTALFVNFPALKAQGGTYTSTLTEIESVGTPQGCTSNCTSYTPAVKWSVHFAQAYGFVRPCGNPGVVPNGSAWNASAIPAGAVGPNSVLLSDVGTFYTPIMTGSFIGTIAIFRSAYVTPRVGNNVALTNSDSSTEVCP